MIFAEGKEHFCLFRSRAPADLRPTGKDPTRHSSLVMSVAHGPCCGRQLVLASPSCDVAETRGRWGDPDDGHLNGVQGSSQEG